ncbi:MAG: rod shape-determining protein MreC [Pseudomonadota bacterium]
MKSLLDVVDPEQTRVGVFAIAGASGGAAARQAIVAGGAQDGVESGQPVRTAAGLIGRTVEVGRNAARVLLITDASSRIPVRVVRTGIPALLLGQGDATVEIDLTGPTSNDVVLGDRLVTSGDGGLFAPGIPVATVVAPDEPRPLARPAALPALGQFVLVEQPYVPPLSPIAEDMFDIMPEAARPADAPLP